MSDQKHSHESIEQYRLESAMEHADRLLDNAIKAAESYKDTHGLTSYQVVLLAQAHMAAASAYLDRGAP